jgi:hypothetical protein
MFPELEDWHVLLLGCSLCVWWMKRRGVVDFESSQIEFDKIK